MEINSLDDLDKLELKIRQKISKFRLGDVLYSLYQIKYSLKPFIVAGVALFAIRFSKPSIVSQNFKLLNIQPIIELVSNYLLADPITFDQELKNNFMGSNPDFSMVRVVYSQFPFEVSEFSQFSRPILLYHEIPNSLVGKAGIPNFDIHKEFLILNGVSIHEFINIGFAASAFAKNNFAFSLKLFAQVCSQGISLLDDKAISQVLHQLAGDRVKITTLYDELKNTDRRFRMYDFNPLRTYPLVFPCKSKGFGNFGQEFMCAPVPGLIDDRMSIGIYYQLFNNFKNTFSNYFGYVLEEYLKLILNNSINSEKFIDIRDLGIKESKSPDYAIIDGSVAIFLECKAIKFKLPAQTISSEEAIKDSLKQVIKGLIQIDTFIKDRASNLDEFHECSTFMPVLVTFEEMYLINSDDFRDYINNELLKKNKEFVNLDWQILSIGELERLQPHLAAGIHLSQVLQDLKHKSFNSVLKELASQTRKTFKDSFLYPKQKELYQRLGLPDRSE
ncbi:MULTISPECIES: hypothetical protein [unclassified Microcoleus]|uniref:hypothetical protein n=1 Tax=unclassified Microcoleus TaxID=2642155 RepID=UPI002FD025EB